MVARRLSCSQKTVRENIVQGTGCCTQERGRAGARRSAGIHDQISNFPKGYDTTVR